MNATKGAEFTLSGTTSVGSYGVISNIAAGFASKLSGFVLLLVISHAFPNTGQRASVWYYWSIALLIYGSLPLQYVHYATMRAMRAAVWPTLALGFSLVAIGLNLHRTLAFPMIWLGIAVVNTKFDIGFLARKRTLEYNLLLSLRNLGAIAAAFAFGNVTWIFLGAVIGESLRLLYGVCRSIGDGGSRFERERIELRGFMLFMQVNALVLACFLLDKSLVYFVAARRLLEYDLLYRILDVPLTALASGLLPLFVAHYRTQGLVEPIKWLGRLIWVATVAGAILLTWYWPLVSAALNVNVSAENFLAGLLFLVGLPLLFKVTFSRREYAVEHEGAVPKLYVSLVLIRLAVLAIYALRFVRVDILVYVAAVNLLMLGIEVLCLHRWQSGDAFVRG